MADTTTRRQLAGLAMGGAAAITAVAASTGPALAYQGNMERGLAALYEALGSLREATANKGGHRVKAMGLIQRAIAEVEDGIDYADTHGND